MIGTKLVVGFDGKAVKSGLAGIGGMMGRLGRQISIGGARQVGAQMTDWVGKLVMAIPEAVSETMDWAGSLDDLSRQTGMATKDLMELSEAFRLAGGEGMDAGRMIGTMRQNLYEASKAQDGEMVDALRLLGLRDSAIETLGPMDQFQKIMQALNATMGSMDPGQLEKTTKAIFGGKMGLKGIAVFKDFNAGLTKARENLGGLSNTAPETIAKIADLGDAVGRFGTVKRGLTMNLMEGLLGVNGLKDATGAVDSFYNKLLGLGQGFVRLGASIRKAIDSFIDKAGKDGLGAAIADLFRQIGKWLGEGIKEGMKSIGIIGGFMDMMQKSRAIRGQESDKMDQLLPFLKPANDAGRAMEKAIFGELQSQNTTLDRIYREKGGMWA
jgi:hypothetical protein